MYRTDPAYTSYPSTSNSDMGFGICVLGLSVTLKRISLCECYITERRVDNEVRFEVRFEISDFLFPKNTNSWNVAFLNSLDCLEKFLGTKKHYLDHSSSRGTRTEGLALCPLVHFLKSISWFLSFVFFFFASFFSLSVHFSLSGIWLAGKAKAVTLSEPLFASQSIPPWAQSQPEWFSFGLSLIPFWSSGGLLCSILFKSINAFQQVLFFLLSAETCSFKPLFQFY